MKRDYAIAREPGGTPDRTRETRVPPLPVPPSIHLLRPVPDSRSRTTAFTLVELMVVIAIVAILASLLLPALGTAQNAAVSTHCQSNLRQLAIALSIYVADYGAYPTYVPRDDGVEGPVGWRSIVNLSDLARAPASRPIRCPSSRGSRQTVGNLRITFDRTYGFNSDGFVNSRGRDLFWGLGGKADDHGWPTIPVQDSDIRSPASLIAMGDGLARNHEPFVVHAGDTIGRNEMAHQDASPGSLAIWQASAQSARLQHDGRANVVFADLHVERLGFHPLFFDPGDAALSIWNRDHLPHR